MSVSIRILDDVARAIFSLIKISITVFPEEKLGLIS